MDIHNLIKLLSFIENDEKQPINTEQNNNDLFSDFIGEYVIVRCHDAGVYAGYLEKANGRVCVLRDSRRLWRWWCKKGISLSAISQYGLNHEKSKIAPVVSKIALTENCEIILCSEEGKQSIIKAEEVACVE